VCLDTSEMLLVQEEFKETVNESGVLMLTEYYPYAQHLDQDIIAAAASEGRNSAGLRRADAIMLTGTVFISLFHLNSLTKGYKVTFEQGLSRVILLSFEPQEAEQQRQDIKRKAASKGYTYSIRIEHEEDPEAKAAAEANQVSSKSQ
jgi:hypothetical protein